MRGKLIRRLQESRRFPRSLRRLGERVRLIAVWESRWRTHKILAPPEGHSIRVRLFFAQVVELVDTQVSEACA